MKKRLFFLIALMCCFVLAACALSACNESGGAGQQTPDGGQPGTETPEQPGGEDPGDEPGEEVIQYRLVYAAASGGSIDGATEQTVEEGEHGTAVTAVPDEGYEFVRWSDGRTDNPRTDSNVTSDVNATAEFRRIELTLTYTAGAGGSITGETSQTVLYGENGTAVTAVPDEGYEFVRWSDGVATATRTDSNVTSDVNVAAEFRHIELTLTYTAGAGGSITGETSQTVLYGESGTAVTAVPEEGYEFVRWSDGVATATRTDSNVTSDVNVAAEFRHIELTLTYTAGTGGNITGETSQTVLYGESGTAIAAVPDEGYEFVRWSDGVTTATRTDSNVTSDVNVTAEFRHIELTLTYTAGTGGSITGETSQAVFYGESGTAVTAVPDEGYEFVRWSDGVKNNPRTDSNVKGNITVTAEFKIIEFSITYAAENGGRIIGLASQTIIRGENGSEVIAVAEEGYKFTKWSDGILTAARTEMNVMSDISVTAEFEIDPEYNFAGGNGSAEDPYQINTSGGLQNIGFYPNAHFVLTADIILPEVGECESNFTPLLSDETMFGGTLDGQGHKIVNLTVYNTETFYSGLFSCIGSSGSVTNLTLENASVSGSNYIGGIAGHALGAVTDCTVTGKITYVCNNSNKVFAGGIAGRAEASVDGCVTDVTITIEDAQAETNAGGIVGYLSYGGSASAPLKLTTHGSITVSSSGDVYAGGLVGYSSGSLYLSASQATGEVLSMSTSGTFSHAGGLVGDGYTVTVTDSYATGNVTSTGTSTHSHAGGLVGDGYTVTVTDSYATGDVTSTGTSNSSCVGGLVGDGSTVTVTDSYATGNVTSVSRYGSYIGGLVGYSNDVTVRNSYSVSCVSAEIENGNVYIGGLAGYVGGSLTLENAHWYGGEGTAAEYAVGYSDSLGIPTSIGSTRHNAVEEFYTLADTLNAGREEPVWEHKGEGTLPTLIEKTQENEEETL